MVSAMSSQTAAAIVMALAEGPLYGDAKDKPMPEPNATTRKVTAVAANAPAMAALQDSGDPARDSPGTATSRSIIATSVMQFLLGASSQTWSCALCHGSACSRSTVRVAFEFHGIDNPQSCFFELSSKAGTCRRPAWFESRLAAQGEGEQTDAP